jgi:hypothetical protein
MRVTVGIVGFLGLGVTVAIATAQPPGGTGTTRRSATLLPPQPLHPSEVPAIARASAEELPAAFGTTPVTRPIVKNPAHGPGWLDGTDTNVRPAGGTAGGRQPTRPLATPIGSPGEEPSLVSKGVDKLKVALGGSTRGQDRMPGYLPPGVAGEQANANTPFRGTAANGAPVYAGPPAYRWYGWGSVTPGANPHAPTGQYPLASANWYAITGATPGAFPVPVMHTQRPTPGTEPPEYVVLPNPRITPHGGNSVPPVIPTSRGMTPPTDAAGYTPPPADLSRVAPTPTPTTVVPPAVTVPAMSAPPLLVITVPVSDKEPPIAAPLSAAPLPLPPLPEIKPAAALPGGPTPLPVMVTEDQQHWQLKPDAPATGEWGPAGKPRTPATAPGTSRGSPGPPVARGQVEETRTDPTATLIRGMCAGRATGVEVRWTGSKKLSVSFGCATPAEAQQLVKDISARAELAPLQIEFSVRLK